MASISRSTTSLRIIGDDLDPEGISRLLGGQPTFAHRKGETVRSPGSDTERVARIGLWSRSSGKCEPENIESQVAELLGGLTQDLTIWRGITGRYRTDVFCGLFMQRLNEGLSLSPKLMVDLGSRGIEIGFDVYGHNDGGNLSDGGGRSARSSP